MLSSQDNDIVQVARETMFKNVEFDSIRAAYSTIKAAINSLKNKNQEAAWCHLSSLTIQGESVSEIAKEINSADIHRWSKVVENCPTTISNFAHKALLQVLPTAANLYRWKKVTDPQCPLCKNGTKQTNKHVFSNCSSRTALQRYTVRHNEVLNMLTNWLKSVLATAQTLHADIENGTIKSTSDLFSQLRPDIAILDANTVTTLELTVCHESNLAKSKIYKEIKYKDISLHRLPQIRNRTIKTFTIEVSTLGLMSSSQDFTRSVSIPAIPNELKERIIRSVLNSSFKIYCGRNSE